MAFEFKFPDVGEGIHEGEIVHWRVKVGDTVKEDQPLVEVETAKAIVELPSPKAGTVLAIFGKEGDNIKVGVTLVLIGEKGEKATLTSQLVENQKGPEQASPGVIGRIPTEEKGVVLPSRKPETSAAKAASAPVLPATRKLAADLKVDLTKISGTGAGGQITEEDVRKNSNQFHFEKYGTVENLPLHGVRKAIAEHMVKSKSEIPHVTHMDELDASALVKLRESKKAEAAKKGIKLTYLPFIIKAAIESLKKHPGLNAFFDGAGNQIVYKKYYNIAIAVDTPEGLMLPVIKDADKKDIFEIAKEIVDLAAKCRDRKIDLKDLQGGSFSITNIGSVGGIMATPIISYGQTANLGLYRIKEKPIAIDGKVEIRPILSLTITYDHRVVDGAEGARFMNDLMAELLK
ncbi:MAG: dihydrolipoamide acetyltransferase family protein [Candidatus Gracilibacteria bacterium]